MVAQDSAEIVPYLAVGYDDIIYVDRYVELYVKSEMSGFVLVEIKMLVLILSHAWTDGVVCGMSPRPGRV